LEEDVITLGAAVFELDIETVTSVALFA